MAIFELANRLKEVSDKAGVYCWLDKHKKIIYIGKANNLKKRMNQYLVKTHNYKMTKMLLEIEDFNYIITKTSADALLLEQSMIKKEMPYYNILFKDNKRYPYVVITKEELPRLLITRNINNKDYFIGPFPDGSGIRKIVSLIQRFFPLRRCSTKQNKACFYSHLHQCINLVCRHESDNDFATNIKKIKAFFNSNSREIVKLIKALMDQASAIYDYESANEYKSLINLINDFINNSEVIFNDLINRDVISFYVEDNVLNITVFQYKVGKLQLSRNFMFQIKTSLIDVLEQFINYFYENNLVPKEIIIDQDMLNDVIKTFLDNSQTTKKVTITKSKQGLKKKILNLVAENSLNYFQNHIKDFLHDEKEKAQIKFQLSELLKVERISNIAVFDNSHFQGIHNIGAVIINNDFQFIKNEYRYYKIGDSFGDDCKTFKEVVYRFLHSRLINKIALPDLIIIDGALAQYQVAQKTIAAFNLTDKISLMSLVKDNKHTTKSAIVNNEETIIKKPLFYFMAKLQTEVDRFAKAKMHEQHLKYTTTNSPLNNIKGIGKQRKEKLLAEFKTVYNIKKASLEELAKIVPWNIALKIKSESL